MKMKSRANLLANGRSNCAPLSFMRTEIRVICAMRLGQIFRTRTSFSAKDAEGAQRTLRRSEPVDGAGNSVAHMRDIKIREIAQPDAAKAQIAQQLTAMNRRNGLNSL
jgi:hypothetical protein